MTDKYSYPLDIRWQGEELLKVMAMWQAVEKAYEEGISAEELLESHQEFKTVIKSIGEERQLGYDFEEVSGYSLYRTMKEARLQKKGRIKMERNKK